MSMEVMVGEVATVTAAAATVVDKDKDKDKDLPLTVALLALLHDVEDHKYASDQTDPNERRREKLADALRDAPVDVAARVQAAVPRISFSHQRKNPDPPGTPVPLELRIVRDADRLDAMGAVGIARCFTFGGARSCSLASSRAHFDEKLLILRDMLTTREGKRRGEERHLVMSSFCRSFDAEQMGLVGLRLDDLEVVADDAEDDHSVKRERIYPPGAVDASSSRG